MPEMLSRFQGCLLGVALGDALGALHEGQDAEWIRQTNPTPESLIDHPPFDELYYTDDTQMTISVAESLIQDGEIIEATLCKAFVDNYEPTRGYGMGARRVIESMAAEDDYRFVAETIFPGGSYGNGAAMRVAPIGLFFHTQPEQVWVQARRSAIPTHIHPLGIAGAQLLALAVTWCLRTETFDRNALFDYLLADCEQEVYREKLSAAKRMSSVQELSQLGNGIAAQESVVTAITSFSFAPESYAQTIGQAILLGGDTDTIAAMAGALSGAWVGIEALPESLMNVLERTVKGAGFLAELGASLHRAWERKFFASE